MIGQIQKKDGVDDRANLPMYEVDISSTTARATKLTDKHISPNSFEKMSVKLVTQVFSHTVSSAMHSAVAMGQLPAKANETAEFLAKLNNISTDPTDNISFGYTILEPA